MYKSLQREVELDAFAKMTKKFEEYENEENGTNVSACIFPNIIFFLDKLTTAFSIP